MLAGPRRGAVDSMATLSGAGRPLHPSLLAGGLPAANAAPVIQSLPLFSPRHGRVPVVLGATGSGGGTQVHHHVGSRSSGPVVLSAWAPPVLVAVDVELTEVPPMAFFKIGVQPSGGAGALHHVMKCYKDLEQFQEILLRELQLASSSQGSDKVPPLPPARPEADCASMAFLSQLNLYLSRLAHCPDVAATCSFRNFFQLSDDYQRSDGTPASGSLLETPGSRPSFRSDDTRSSDAPSRGSSRLAFPSLGLGDSAVSRTGSDEFRMPWAGTSPVGGGSFPLLSPSGAVTTTQEVRVSWNYSTEGERGSVAAPPPCAVVGSRGVAPLAGREQGSTLGQRLGRTSLLEAPLRQPPTSAPSIDESEVSSPGGSSEYLRPLESPTGFGGYEDLTPPTTADSTGRSGKRHGKRRCVICMRRGPEMALDPCGHFSFCRECVQTVKTCPLCRTPIEKALRVYVA